MAPLRSLLVLLIILGLVSAATAVAQAPVEWYSDTSGGGTVAGPAPQHYSGGGALAPSLNTPTTPAPSPNLPPPTEAPKLDQSPPAETARAGRATAAPARASHAPAARPAAAAAPAAPAASGDGLPFTGLELAAVAAAGLCLLAGGFALRPARR
jgi:hypothetical protein